MSSSQQENTPLQAGWDPSTESRSFMVLAVVAVLAMLLNASFAPVEKSVEAPFVGYLSSWEATLLLRLRFCTRAFPIVTEGYKRMRAFRGLVTFVFPMWSDDSIPIQGQHVDDSLDLIRLYIRFDH